MSEVTVYERWESMRDVMGLCSCPGCWSAYIRALEAPHFGPPDPLYPVRAPRRSARDTLTGSSDERSEDG